MLFFNVWARNGSREETLDFIRGSGADVVVLCVPDSQIADAAARIRLGEADVMIAAGTESMSMVPMMGNSPSLSPSIFADTQNVEKYGIAYGMGLTAEKVARQWNISREQQDAFALASNQKACAAIAAGHFKAETTPYAIRESLPDLKTGEIKLRERTVDTDEGPRADASLERLGKLKPVFHARGSVTAGMAIW